MRFVVLATIVIAFGLLVAEKVTRYHPQNAGIGTHTTVSSDQSTDGI